MIMLFHYDGHTSEWDQFEWSKRAIHISVRKQTKWLVFVTFSVPTFLSTLNKSFINPYTL